MALFIIFLICDYAKVSLYLLFFLFFKLIGLQKINFDDQNRVFLEFLIIIMITNLLLALITLVFFYYL